MPASHTGISDTSLILPPLPFGERFTKAESDIQLFSDRMATVVTSLNYYESAGQGSGFRCKIHPLVINGLKLVASANTPVNVDIGSTHDVTLMIPFRGENISTLGKKKHRWQASHNAMLLPATGRGGQCSTRSTLTIDIDPLRIQQVAAAMLGLDNDKPVNLHLGDDRLVPLQIGSLSFSQVFQNLCNSIDLLLDQPQALQQLGVDDLFYRKMAILLRPDLFLRESIEGPRSTENHRLATVCDHIRANLDQPLTLTDLEQVSGMSARNLQYAFQRQFQCTPVQWIREQRLLQARRLLSEAKANTTITRVAMDCGFGSMSQFATYYRKRFGLLPSQNLSRRNQLMAG